MTSASDQATTPPTADRSAREAIIRDLYALVAFYVANPDHPLPHAIQVFHHAPLTEIKRIAAERGGLVYGEYPQTDHHVAGTSMPISLLVSLPVEDRPL